MLDINDFRAEKGGNPELIRESQRKRYGSVESVDKVISLDVEWRDKSFALDQLKREFNARNKAIGMKKKKKEDASAEQAEAQSLKAAIAEAEAEEKKIIAERDALLFEIGNIVHESVPVSNDEKDNRVEKTWGDVELVKTYSHTDLVHMLGIVDLERGSTVAGGRGYYLTGYGVLLNQALINYAMSFLVRRGSEPVHTPFFMRREVMAECAQLSQFDEELYKVTGEGDDKYLIATSEQPLCSLFRKRWLEPKELPARIAGYSTCFRKEVGSHGRDTLGIFRVHQFEKVEQFCVTSPDADESWAMQEEMLKSSEDFYKSLNVPYRVVNIISGELNNAAARKFDLEAWFPGSKPPAFRELVSCSNCTDYQSRRLEARVRGEKGGSSNSESNSGNKGFVHMLNSTLTATERTLCCILENWQTEDGVVVPDVLRPFMMGIAFIPFVKKIKETSAGGKSKKTTVEYEDVPGAVKKIVVPEEPTFGESDEAGVMYT